MNPTIKQHRRGQKRRCDRSTAETLIWSRLWQATNHCRCKKPIYASGVRLASSRPCVLDSKQRLQASRIGAAQGLYLESSRQKQASWVRITGCGPRNRTSGKPPPQPLNTLQCLSPWVKAPNFATHRDFQVWRSREVRPDTCLQSPGLFSPLIIQNQ